MEPAYLIYLNFYAATSLEMCAKPLASASAYRNSLLQQAKAHYEKAAALLRAAEETALSRSRSSSAASSLPSLHSPSGSISSRAWTPDCGAVTPTSAISRKSSLVQQPLQQQLQQQQPGAGAGGTTTTADQHQQQQLPSRGGAGRPAKKKVSFELPKDQSRWSFTLPEPVIRPDSPTLGFDDEYFAAGALRQELPEVPPPAPTTTTTTTNKRSSLRQDPFFEAPTPSLPSMPSISEGEVLGSSSGSPAGSPSTASSSGDDNDNEYPFFRSHYDHHQQQHSQHDPNADPESARALARYCETLTSLKTQVTSHMAALQRLMEASDDDGLAQEDEKQQQQQHAPESPTTSQVAASFHRMSLGATARQQRSYSVATCSSSGSGGGDEVGGGECRGRERQARIDRLRMNGWKRKRFDVSRYEELCDTVMEELDRRDG